MPLDDTTKHYEQALAPQADPLPQRMRDAFDRYGWGTVFQRNIFTNRVCLIGAFNLAEGRDARATAPDDVTFRALASACVRLRPDLRRKRGKLRTDHQVVYSFNDFAKSFDDIERALAEFQTALARAEALATSEAGGR